jgi:putative radical SAM enzyme (TIGR03279 family)
LAVKIQAVTKGSRAFYAGIYAGEVLTHINGHEIFDVLDYRFYETEQHLVLKIENQAGESRKISIRKGQYEPIGLEFETYLMDQKHSCRNRCIFCFIDQLPSGMRDSLYFKDDDARLSFLFGNYISLTNLQQRDVDRIIAMHISPVNISVHTTNPQLRCQMMNNRFAGDSLQFLYAFAAHGIQINCQLVLCPGINDGEELKSTLENLGRIGQNLGSIACVPVGITRYRDGLYPLRTYSAREAADTLSIIEEYGRHFLEQRGSRVVYASDEFYLLAGRPIPHAAYYEDFPQIENGVGMMASMEDEFSFALEQSALFQGPRRITAATGEAAAPFIGKLLERIRQKYPGFDYQLVPVKNLFFGGTVNVAGLLTGEDMIRELLPLNLGDEVLIPACTLRREGDLFLDNVSIEEMSRRLNRKVTPVENNGEAFLLAALGAAKMLG